ncbi:hypothetical protein FE839_13520 [Klebsiella indica]|uniref:Uncharacterized protein n=1 Tax=Klebsiella indica TaxID=2582917 RepID=A0A5R9LGJ7_9ENTR|nr:hypothetical protein FE839_13520 [Klebsiella indica]
MMIAWIILVPDDVFVLPFSAIDWSLFNVLILFVYFYFLIISAYFVAFFMPKKVPFHLQIEIFCGYFETP